MRAAAVLLRTARYRCLSHARPRQTRSTAPHYTRVPAFQQHLAAADRANHSRSQSSVRTMATASEGKQTPVGMETDNPHPAEVSEQLKKAGKEAPQPGQPGYEEAMKVQPQFIRDDYKGSDKLAGKIAVITGGDSGIGRAVAIHFAREGAKGIAIVYKEEHGDAKKTVELVNAEGCPSCLCIPGDVGDPEFCSKTIDQVVKEMGGLDIVVNNAAEQHARESIKDITKDQLQRTFATNLFSMFYLTKAALPHLKQGSSVINTTSVTAYKGKPTLLDYSTTKGGIVAFTRALAQQLVSKGIRVNAVAPGPIWTPLIPATFGEESAGTFGDSTPMKRAGQPSEVATTYVFLASDTCSSYITGQVMHPNGGTVLNV